jgi:gamma-glutamylcyclotransferase (GGCT)/AIG2-like uncharacterized protein YtfP
VYGTLRKYQSLSAYLSNSKYIGNYYILGYDMYSLSDYYPYIMKGNGRITAELYDVNEHIMPVIDKIESGYNREIVKGFNSKGESIKAYIYVWKGEKSLKDSKIENGDWVKYIEELIEKNTLYPIFDKNDIILFDMDEYFISDNSDEIDDKDNKFKNKEFKSYEFSNDIFKFLDNYDEFSDENENDYLEITDDEKLDAYDLWKKYKDRY